ncbi:hypothetical protein B566_EDAN017190 [Ephemera danica]|nr:hypothetical protein B566_EDAN017190 [Ephemera danica]
MNYSQNLKKQNLKVGDVGVVQNKGRTVFCLITKKQVWHRPTMKTVDMCLEKLREKCEEMGVEKLATPTIASGLDGLN